MVPQDLETHQVLFSGRVQGVGFRWTTKRIAANYAVTGYVRNLADGRVELIAQGDRAVTHAFVDAISIHFTDNITSSEQQICSDDAVFTKFEIRH